MLISERIMAYDVLIVIEIGILGTEKKFLCFLSFAIEYRKRKGTSLSSLPQGKHALKKKGWHTRETNPKSIVICKPGGCH